MNVRLLLPTQNICRVVNILYLLLLVSLDASLSLCLCFPVSFMALLHPNRTVERRPVLSMSAARDHWFKSSAVCLMFPAVPSLAPFMEEYSK